jgi:hypothetical protein
MIPLFGEGIKFFIKNAKEIVDYKMAFYRAQNIVDFGCNIGEFEGKVK